MGGVLYFHRNFLFLQVKKKIFFYFFELGLFNFIKIFFFFLSKRRRNKKIFLFYFFEGGSLFSMILSSCSSCQKRRRKKYSSSTSLREGSLFLSKFSSFSFKK